jgi:hypothetical protein
LIGDCLRLFRDEKGDDAAAYGVDLPKGGGLRQNHWELVGPAQPSASRAGLENVAMPEAVETAWMEASVSRAIRLRDSQISQEL